MLHLKLFLSLLALSIKVVAIGEQLRLDYESPQPWVDIQSIPEKVNNSQEPYNYLLIDNQFNATTKAYYYKYAYQVNNSEGVQQMSSVEISYDPSYQKIVLHEIQIIREGQPIRVKPEFIELQRESSMEQALYTGDITIVSNIQDIRIGDVLAYSYTVDGGNPILGDHAYASFYQEYAVPIARIHQSIITNKKVEIYDSEGSRVTQVSVPPFGMRYEWDMDNIQPKYLGQQCPMWYNPYSRVELSDYNSWEAVSEWALPLYEVDDNSLDKIASTVKGELDLSISTEENIIEIIEFVQDEIRYLGYEYGINAYQPHDPYEVLSNRFGDCKDKSLLLVSLLRMVGIEAHPVLVNTTIGPKLIDYLPSPLNFDHCIVQLKHNQSSYYIDPTISQQRGGLLRRHIPHYGYALPIMTESIGLVYVNNDIIPMIQIQETLTVNEVGGSGHMEINTRYHDQQADQTRSNIMSQGLEGIKQNYKSFYTDLFSTIETPEIKYQDSIGIGQNILLLSEKYEVPKMWESDESLDKVTLSYIALDLQQKLNRSENYNLDEPYYLGNQVEFIQLTEIKLPEEWTIKNDPAKISNPYFDYSYSISNQNDDKTISISHRYYQKKEYIEPSDIEKTLQDYAMAYENTGYQLYKDEDAIQGSDSAIAWILILIALTIGSVMGYFLIKALHAYDPYTPRAFDNKEIGGWMILPLIGLFITPLLIMFNVFMTFENEGVGLNTIETLWTTQEIDNGKIYVYWLLIDWIILLNIIIYVITAAYLFIRRRSSLPNIIIGFYMIYLLYLLLSMIVNVMMGEDTESSYITDIIRQFISSGVWSAYFLMSERVKETFTRRLNQFTPPISQDLSLG